ncbi:hypothetical protein C8Q73DRAFT_48380 [Cubamyces lactineus]|nr:hypothetical protein C8Q73DRAFT_48380 [Cubamyces lactineus]
MARYIVVGTRLLPFAACVMPCEDVYCLLRRLGSRRTVAAGSLHRRRHCSIIRHQASNIQCCSVLRTKGTRLTYHCNDGHSELVAIAFPLLATNLPAL